jgi:hypothetical protein
MSSEKIILTAYPEVSTKWVYSVMGSPDLCMESAMIHRIASNAFYEFTSSDWPTLDGEPKPMVTFSWFPSNNRIKLAITVSAASNQRGFNLDNAVSEFFERSYPVSSKIVALEATITDSQSLMFSSVVFSGTSNMERCVNNFKDEITKTDTINNVFSDVTAEHWVVNVKNDKKWDNTTETDHMKHCSRGLFYADTGCIVETEVSSMHFRHIIDVTLNGSVQRGIIARCPVHRFEDLSQTFEFSVETLRSDEVPILIVADNLESSKTLAELTIAHF